MNKNGCWNRKPLSKTATVQKGWFYSTPWLGIKDSRSPIMEIIKDPMTKTCQYQILTKDDPKCQGCKEMEP